MYLYHSIIVRPLQLGLWLNQILNLLKSIKELQALWIQQRTTRFNSLATDNFLNGQLNLFPVDSRLDATLA